VGKGGGTNFGKGTWGNKGGGKGKKGGYDNGKGSKGGGKGEKGRGKGFDGYCNYCWKCGYRKAECEMLDPDMAKNGRKGNKGGKGAYELQADGDEKGEEHHPEDAEEGEWWVGALCALSRDEAQHHTRIVSRRAARARTLEADSLKSPGKSLNSFAALACDDDADQEDGGDI
jgi:hypothetical protein